MKNTENQFAASSRGLYFNTGNGSTLQPVDIGHRDYMGLVDPDTAFWALVRKEHLGKTLSDGPLLRKYRRKAAAFAREMHSFRFELKPSAVYFNPTERCNLNCSYCYLPQTMRRSGGHMAKAELDTALARLRDFFKRTLPDAVKPQIIFHGAEPMLNRQALFPALDQFKDDFRFGIQTNGTLLDDEAIEFLTARNTAIGLSLDADVESIASRTRKTWGGNSVFDKVIQTIGKLKGYPNCSVICTVTRENVRRLVQIVEFFHGLEIPACMLNPIRCTQKGARPIKPDDHEQSRHFFKALDRTYELYQETGRKLVVANFANILVAILAPQARRLMCDISPCGGGRCFFAVSAKGELFPCSEFIGLSEFNGGNLFKDKVEDVLQSAAFRKVTERKVEDIDPCRRCAVRHFCGSPCPAEAHEMNGGMHRTGAFCEHYEDQVRYAFRLIADNRHEAFLWNNWDADTKTSFEMFSL
ncbi:MAG: peptide-modifying radical SAM enzyme CbpB [Verrucomicrobia bacterium]|nr:peptide-modifying radical SAM enzyme CbpB [Verrucomicrobiota bacterium]